MKRLIPYQFSAILLGIALLFGVMANSIQYFSDLAEDEISMMSLTEEEEDGEERKDTDETVKAIEGTSAILSLNLLTFLKTESARPISDTEVNPESLDIFAPPPEVL